MTPLRPLFLFAIVALPVAIPYVASSSVRPQDENQGELARRYFGIADYDSGGWVSFAEASQSLLISREEFRRYDIDQDGGIDRTEFEARYRRIVETQGIFQPPIPAPKRALNLPTPTLSWFQRFDSDGSGSWDLAELSLALEDRDLSQLATAENFTLVDADRSGRLEAPEINAVLQLVTLSGGGLRARASSVRELFGKALPTPVGPGVVPSPARLPGPLPVFERLDVNGDGVCSDVDLRELAFPAALPIRPQALLAALDRDGDGALSAAEFQRALLAE